MPANRVKRVFYVNWFGHPRFAEVLAARADFQLDRLVDGSAAHEAEAVIAAAHAYQVSSGVNDQSPAYLVNDALLSFASNLLVVSTIGAGYDTVDLAACTRAGVLAVNQSGGGNAQAVAEHILGMMLGLAKRMPEAVARMRRAPDIVRGDYIGRNTKGKTLGIIGFGNVGRILATICRAALGMRVLVCDSHRLPGEIGASGCEQVALDTLLREADYVSVCCALNAETRGLIGAAQFAMMRRDAFFITTARGGIHDEAALINALQEKRIAGAGVDVWDVEPPRPDHPLLAMDNVIATPHTGGTTVESRIQAAEGAAQKIITILDGGQPPRLLNPEAWPRYCERFSNIMGFAPHDQRGPAATTKEGAPRREKAT
jgi:D-3-phosphoglycerate dehydrogenase